MFHSLRKSIVLLFALGAIISFMRVDCCWTRPLIPQFTVQFNGFTNEELSSIYLTSTHLSDTTFEFVDTISQEAIIYAHAAPSIWFIQSDSFHLHKDVVFYSWETTGGGKCRSVKEGVAKLEFDGHFYTFRYEPSAETVTSPLVITK